MVVRMKDVMPGRSAPKRIPWEQIQALLKKGYEPRDIALRFGCSTQNIYNRIRKHRDKHGAA